MLPAPDAAAGYIAQELFRPVFVTKLAEAGYALEEHEIDEAISLGLELLQKEAAESAPVSAGGRIRKARAKLAGVAEKDLVAANTSGAPFSPQELRELEEVAVKVASHPDLYNSVVSIRLAEADA